MWNYNVELHMVKGIVTKTTTEVLKIHPTEVGFEGILTNISEIKIESPNGGQMFLKPINNGDRYVSINQHGMAVPFGTRKEVIKYLKTIRSNGNASMITINTRLI